MKYLLLLIVPLVIADLCTGPYVDADAQHNSSSQCVVTDNQINYVRTCGFQGDYCDKFDGTCYNYVKYDGDPCTQNSDCPVKCLEGYCRAWLKDTECDDHRECSIGLFCDIQGNRTCQPQKNEGETCSDIFNCKNHLACDKATKKCVPLFSQPEGADCDNTFGLSSQWSWQCESAYCNKLSKCQSTNLPANSQANCAADTDCKLSTGDQGTCQCSWTQKGENYCNVQPGDSIWTDVVDDVKKLLLPFLKNTNNVCHTKTRFASNCWNYIQEGATSFGIFYLESQQAFQLNGVSFQFQAPWSTLSSQTFASFFPQEQVLHDQLHFTQTCYNYNCTNTLKSPQCIKYDNGMFWISNQQCQQDQTCPATTTETDQNCVNDVEFQWKMPGQFCGNDNSVCFPQTRCSDKYCKGKKESDLCYGQSDLSCDVGFACIKDQASGQYYCKKQLQVSESCENSYQCQNDAFCSGGMCIGMLTQDVDTLVKGQCYNLNSNIKVNIACKSLQCQNFDDQYFKCTKGFTTDSAIPKEASYIKQCASIRDDYVEYSQINCSYSQHGSKSYCGVHLGDKKGLDFIDSIHAIKNLSQGVCHSSKRFDPECWYNRLKKHWDAFKNYYSLKQQLFFYPQVTLFYIQLDNADQCTAYVYFNEYFNVNYNAKNKYEESGDNSVILSFVFFLLILMA